MPAPYATHVAKLRLAPGDLLVVKVPGGMSAADHAATLADVRKVLPDGVNALLLEPGWDVERLTKAQVEAVLGRATG